MKRFFFLTFLYFLSSNTQALVPLESLILGDFSGQFENRDSDPVNYIFRRDQFDKSSKEDISQIAMYRGMLLEGENLKDFCEKKQVPVTYGKPEKKEQVIRSLSANFQLMGLDLTVRALSEYAKFFDFTRDEYRNLSTDLVTNYCSENLTVISKRQLYKNLMVHFEKGKFDLPASSENNLLPEVLEDINSLSNARKQEFYHTVNLFKSFCSWGGDHNNLRLMTTLMQNPVLASLNIRRMTGNKLRWNESTNSFSLVEDSDGRSVVCENFICRSRDRSVFVERIPKTVGHKSLDDDLKRVHCQHVMRLRALPSDQVPKIKKMMDSLSFDDQNFMISQLVSLITKLPDWLIWARNFDDLKSFARASVDQTWNKWALGQNEKRDTHIFYEEPLTVEVVDRSFYWNNKSKDFKVVFDVNLGEFDRLNQMVGKIKTKFYVKTSKRFINWMRREWVNADPREPGKKERLFNQFVGNIKGDVERARKKFLVAPWNEGLSKLIVRELLGQMENYRGKLYGPTAKGMVEIPVELAFGPFALKYLDYKRSIQEKNDTSSSFLR